MSSKQDVALDILREVEDYDYDQTLYNPEVDILFLFTFKYYKIYLYSIDL